VINDFAAFQFYLSSRNSSQFQLPDFKMLKLPGLIYRNKFALPGLPPPGSFNGNSILITGASGGLGLAAAVHFVNLGASSVIITARTDAKATSAVTEIERQTNTEGKEIVKGMVLDMSTFAGTKAFAEEVKNSVKNIDYVLLNAGLLNKKFAMGCEGFEETIQVNVLSTALLALLLLPWIKEAGNGKAHLGFVTSGGHRDTPIDRWPEVNTIDWLSKEENWPAKGMYSTSKLLEHYVVREITKLGSGPDGRYKLSL
jgi:NAD(P)-dependent dehydrogenase (short-subunit alcohol dehydrogenase family)